MGKRIKAPIKILWRLRYKKEHKCKICNLKCYGTLCRSCYNKLRRKGVA